MRTWRFVAVAVDDVAAAVAAVGSFVADTVDAAAGVADAAEPLTLGNAASVAVGPERAMLSTTTSSSTVPSQSTSASPSVVAAALSLPSACVV